MDRKSFSLFVGFGLINLTIVAMIGVIMRYKIGFEFPFLNQKYLLHGHSHFAFAGWVTHILYTLMVWFLSSNGINTKKYYLLIWANLLCAFGMLISFIAQGYGVVSITFSTLSILVSYIISYQYFKDLISLPKNLPSIPWFKAALFFNILSSLGTFFLAYMMMTKTIQQNHYLGSVYFYLHFQYSGWFFFAMMGLLFSKMSQLETFKNDKVIFNTFFIACIPAYILSILWAKMPVYLYFLPIAAVLLQLYGLYKFSILLRSITKELIQKWSFFVRMILGLSFLALIIKLLLQTGSLHPEISKLAYGFRSIVIAYLHLVLLAITTLFLLGFLVLTGYIKETKKVLVALTLFIVGVFANEFVLMVQGVASFGYVLIPYLNESLLAISLLMFFAMVLLSFYFHKRV